MIFYSCYGVFSYSLEAVFLSRILILFIYINSNSLEVEKIFFFPNFYFKNFTNYYNFCIVYILYFSEKKAVNKTLILIIQK